MAMGMRLMLVAINTRRKIAESTETHLDYKLPGPLMKDGTVRYNSQYRPKPKTDFARAAEGLGGG
jgi:hypothetical protein